MHRGSHNESAPWPSLSWRCCAPLCSTPTCCCRHAALCNAAPESTKQRTFLICSVRLGKDPLHAVDCIGRSGPTSLLRQRRRRSSSGGHCAATAACPQYSAHLCSPLPRCALLLPPSPWLLTPPLSRRTSSITASLVNFNTLVHSCGFLLLLFLLLLADARGQQFKYLLVLHLAFSRDRA